MSGPRYEGSRYEAPPPPPPLSIFPMFEFSHKNDVLRLVRARGFHFGERRKASSRERDDEEESRKGLIKGAHMNVKNNEKAVFIRRRKKRLTRSNIYTR